MSHSDFLSLSGTQLIRLIRLLTSLTFDPVSLDPPPLSVTRSHFDCVCLLISGSFTTPWPYQMTLSQRAANQEPQTALP